MSEIIRFFGIVIRMYYNEEEARWIKSLRIQSVI
jgi:hypothetical protein